MTAVQETQREPGKLSTCSSTSCECSRDRYFLVSKNPESLWRRRSCHFCSENRSSSRNCSWNCSFSVSHVLTDSFIESSSLMQRRWFCREKKTQQQHHPWVRQGDTTRVFQSCCQLTTTPLHGDLLLKNNSLIKRLEGIIEGNIIINCSSC